MAEEPLPVRRDLQRRLIEKAWKEPAFKAEVLKNPKGMLESHLGRKLPEDLKILMHEEDANTLHFSIPLPPSNVAELSDEELERVAGGTEVVGATMLVGAALGIGAVAGVMGSLAANAAKGW